MKNYKKLITNVTLGSDPELFLKKENIIISAVGKIGGTKHEPQPISDSGHAIQEDNIAIEYNIPACKNETEWIDNHNFVKSYLDNLVTGMGCELDFSASAKLSDQELDSDQAKLFGCEPDFNVWLQRVNDPPEPGGNLRVCGGHIAVGFDNPTDEVCEDLVKAMDATLGLKSLFIDKDTERKKMYGKAGCFRFKEFGIEYRVLSNFWIASDQLLIWAYNTTLEAIELVNSGKIKNIINNFSDKIVEAINTNNKDLAKKILDDIEVIVNDKIKVANE